MMSTILVVNRLPKTFTVDSTRLVRDGTLDPNQNISNAVMEYLVLSKPEQQSDGIFEQQYKDRIQPVGEITPDDFRVRKGKLLGKVSNDASLKYEKDISQFKTTYTSYNPWYMNVFPNDQKLIAMMTQALNGSVTLMVGKRIGSGADGSVWQVVGAAMTKSPSDSFYLENVLLKQGFCSNRLATFRGSCYSFYPGAAVLRVLQSFQYLTGTVSPTLYNIWSEYYTPSGDMSHYIYIQKMMGKMNVSRFIDLGMISVYKGEITSMQLVDMIENIIKVVYVLALNVVQIGFLHMDLNTQNVVLTNDDTEGSFLFEERSKSGSQLWSVRNVTNHIYMVDFDRVKRLPGQNTAKYPYLRCCSEFKYSDDPKTLKLDSMKPNSVLGPQFDFQNIWLPSSASPQQFPYIPTATIFFFTAWVAHVITYAQLDSKYTHSEFYKNPQIKVFKNVMIERIAAEQKTLIQNCRSHEQLCDHLINTLQKSPYVSKTPGPLPTMRKTTDPSPNVVLYREQDMFRTDTESVSKQLSQPENLKDLFRVAR